MLPAALVASIPPPPVHNLALGPFVLHLYGLLIGIGIVVAINVFERNVRAQGRRSDDLMAIVLPAVVAGFVGARLYHVFSEPVRYYHHPADIVKVWQGGLGIYGAVALGAATAVVLARRRGVPVAMMLDAAAPAIAIAQAIGRWGNYVNQELFGRPTSLPWGLEVDAAHRPSGFADARTFHPTFLYESLWVLLLGVVLAVLLRRWRARAGYVIFCLYAAGYSLERFFVEGLRIDTAHTWLGLRQNQWVALAIFVVAAGCAAWLQWRHGRRRART